MMQDEEKIKRKGKRYFSRRIVLVLACSAFILLFACGSNLLAYLQGRPYSEVAMLNGMYSEEIEEFLLEKLPLGTSHAAVKTFIAEYLQPSTGGQCVEDASDEPCSLRIEGRNIVCSLWWYISFRFMNNALSDISVEVDGICL